MKNWKVGDQVQITDLAHPYYRRIGIVKDIGKIGGLWIQYEEDEVVYHPWGYDVIQEKTEEIE